MVDDLIGIDHRGKYLLSIDGKFRKNQQNAKKKVQNLGDVITTFKRDIEESNALVNPGTPLEKDAEHKSAIEEFATQLEQMEKEAKLVTDVNTQFWGSVVQNEQLEKLNKQLGEGKAQLATLRTSLRIMPPVVHVKKLT